MPDHFDTLDLDGLRREAERLGYVRDPDGGALVAWRAGAGKPPVVRTRGAWAGFWVPSQGDGDEAAALRWLLRQPEAQARAACYARGVADERARAVAWLRESVAHVAPNGQRAAVLAGGTRLLAADALERGEHEVTRG